MKKKYIIIIWAVLTVVFGYFFIYKKVSDYNKFIKSYVYLTSYDNLDVQVDKYFIDHALISFNDSILS